MCITTLAYPVRDSLYVQCLSLLVLLFKGVAITAQILSALCPERLES